MKLWHFSRFSFIWYISQTFRKFSFFNLCSETFNTAQTIKKTILSAKVHALIVHSLSQNLKIVPALFSRKMKNATSHQTLRFVFILLIFYFWKKTFLQKTRLVSFALTRALNKIWSKTKSKIYSLSFPPSLPTLHLSVALPPLPSLSYSFILSLSNSSVSIFQFICQFVFLTISKALINLVLQCFQRQKRKTKQIKTHKDLSLPFYEDIEGKKSETEEKNTDTQTEIKVTLLWQTNKYEIWREEHKVNIDTRCSIMNKYFQWLSIIVAILTMFLNQLFFHNQR
jgi:hypothetical protein